ncbi:MAG: putative transporter [Paludibacteraceae bacterium]|nr:putative transporter [Paludibacteraceae bacterium]
MNWFANLFVGTGIAHTIVMLAIVIAAGIFLGAKLKFKGISLGITWILFCAIAYSHFACNHFGMHLNADVLNFAKDLGLILFVYSIGLQVGPGFFSSFGKGGIKLNMIAFGVVFLGCLAAYLIHVISGEDIAVMTGVLFGAVTNTPGLGAAQQTYQDLTGAANPDIASGYAMAYPLGVVGIILSLLLIRWIFRIKLEKEEEQVQAEKGEERQVTHFDLELTNPQVEGIRVRDLKLLTHVNIVVTRRIDTNGVEMMPDADTLLHVGDKVRFVGDVQNERTILLLGPQIEVTWEEKEKDVHLVSKHIIVSKPKYNGRLIRDLRIREAFNVTISRVRRAGIELLATSDLRLQMGDRLTVVGEQEAVERVSKAFGNSTKKLEAPNLASLFFGIVLGVAFGSIPFALPGLSQPFKLGLAGGSLIIAILMGAFGAKWHVVTYTTTSANLMIREIGISLFLAAVGFGAGEGFVDTLVNGGYVWIGYGVIITLLPLLIMGIIGRKSMKLDYFTLMGTIAGSTTDPPALAYATGQSTSNDRAAVAYSTVYPLTMFLRVLTGQLMILCFL